MWYNGALRGAYNNANGAYTIASDKRLKKDIIGFDYGLSAIQQLFPYKYHYLDNVSNSPLSVGFMAQDVEKIYPEAVHKVLNKEGKEVYTFRLSGIWCFSNQRYTGTATDYRKATETN
ncbi:MAG: tail fiber domain-containing protein [Chitinophagaceae bacterium]|nr:tail fiber domain-containing protein [Chitinophagaceae bacterium]